MTLTKEQSSNKETFESMSSGDLETIIRTSMSHGCVRPAHVFDAVDEVLDRLAKIEKLVQSIDLTKCSPLPWKSQLHNSPVADTGEYDGTCNAMDANGNFIVAKFDDSGYKEVEKGDGDYDADILVICDSINAIKSIKEILK